jgi:uncharacterized protein (TIGR00255 family)
MTGYGKATGMAGSRQITIEIKTLNSKQLDMNMRLPQEYQDYEHEMRTLVTNALERGKVLCMVQIEQGEESISPEINIHLAKAWHNAFLEVEHKLGLAPRGDYLDLLLKMPEIFKHSQVQADEQEQKILIDVLHKALKEVNHFREKEGECMGREISGRIAEMVPLVERITPLEPNRIGRVRERLTKALDSHSGLIASSVDMNRLEQETIYYLEKLDITEEKVRLLNHLNYFMKVMEEPSANGRKLGFIAQEIGREINTLGSKAHDHQIQQIVVELKDELEKIKEQLFNIL